MTDTGIIFVFGSNLAGRHGRGAALVAAQAWGAEYGVGEGRTGSAYAIPTKGKNMKTRSLKNIRISVERFIEYAIENPGLTFRVTRVGCGLAGYADKQIAPMFAKAPSNCELPDYWRDLGRSE